MEEADKGRLMTTIGVSGWMFLLVPAHPDCTGQDPESRKMVVCVYYYYYYYYRFTTLWILSWTMRVSWYQKPICIYWSKWW